MRELKSCPFCGRAPEVRETKPRGDDCPQLSIYCELGKHNAEAWAYVTNDEDRAKVYAEWNRRAEVSDE